jgi:hypothetical protein
MTEMECYMCSADYLNDKIAEERPTISSNAFGSLTYTFSKFEIIGIRKQNGITVYLERDKDALKEAGEVS